MDRVMASTYNISSNNLNYIDLKKNNLLPYTSSIQSTINSNNSIQYFYVDQLIIYNPNSTNNLAILIQVDSVLYIKNMGGTIPVGKNNYALTISSILFNPSTNTITSNKNSISKVALNFNAQSSSIFEFIVNNGGNSNNTVSIIKDLIIIMVCLNHRQNHLPLMELSRHIQLV